MGKRPYYIISRNKYWEGENENYIDYVGTNYKAALHRYNKICDYLHQRDFIDEGVEEDRIEIYNSDIPAEMTPGHYCYTRIDDENLYYYIELRCFNTNRFTSDWFEDKYKEEFPNAKY